MDFGGSAHNVKIKVTDIKDPEQKLGSPDKVSAHGAESGLPEEGGDELVVLDEMDLGLLDGSSPTVDGGSLFLLRSLLTLFQVEEETNTVLFINYTKIFQTDNQHLSARSLTVHQQS